MNADGSALLRAHPSLAPLTRDPVWRRQDYPPSTMSGMTVSPHPFFLMHGDGQRLLPISRAVTVTPPHKALPQLRRCEIHQEAIDRHTRLLQSRGEQHHNLVLLGM